AVSRRGVPRRFPAEDQDRARRGRLDRRASDRGDQQRGAHRQDRRRQGLRHRARPDSAHPHRRDGRRGSLKRSVMATRRATVRKILATSGAFMQLERTRLALALLGLAVLVLLIGMQPAAAQEAAAATPPPAYEKGDISWMLVSTLLVLMMAVPGL